MNMFTQFVLKKMKTARYKKLEDGLYFGTIPGYRGVWGSARTLVACKKELQETFEDWLLYKVHCHDKIPGFNMKFGEPVAIEN
jgi:predicted RNase H-like HicB family nuclease